MRNLHLGLYTPNQGVQKHFDSLFHSTRATTEKKKILEEEFGVAMNEELERKVLVMEFSTSGCKIKRGTVQYPAAFSIRQDSLSLSFTTSIPIEEKMMGVQK